MVLGAGRGLWGTEGLQGSSLPTKGYQVSLRIFYFLTLYPLLYSVGNAMLCQICITLYFAVSFKNFI